MAVTLNLANYGAGVYGTAKYGQYIVTLVGVSATSAVETVSVGYLDKIDVSEVGRFEAGLLNNLRSKHSDLLEYITNEDPKIKGEAADKISSVLDEFSADFA